MKRKNKNNPKNSTSIKRKSLWIFITLAFLILTVGYYSFNESFTGNSITGAFLGIPDINTQAENASCGTITEDTNITQNISSTETCITIGAPNIILDCQGYTITYSFDGTLGYGVHNPQNYDDIIIRNCNISEGSAVTNSKHGILLLEADNWTIENSTVNTMGSSSYGIYSLDAVSNSIINQTTIMTSSTSAYGIRITNENSDNNLVDNSIIETTGSAAHGIYITSGDNNNITNSNITCTGSGSHATYLEGTANSNLIENSQITALIGTAAYIYGSSANNNILKNNYFHSNRSSVPAVQISYGDNNQIINNVINQSNSAGHNAIYLFSTADNTLIESNNMTTNVTIVDEDAHAVLFISGSSFTNVSNNQMNNSNQVGFYVTGTTEAHYDHNFSNNHHDGLPAKYFGPNDVSTNFSDTTVNALWVAKDNFIVNNINITDSKGVILAYADNVVINETSAVSSLANIEGLYLIHSEDNLIYHSNFSTSASSTSAVNFYSGSNSNRNSFYNCIFSTTSTSAHGIQINDENSDNNLVDNSIIETTGGAAHGIYITSGDNNNITNSNITCTGSGSHATYLEGTANSNLIENSQITALIGTAAYIYGSSANNNILKNNYFHSNRSSVPAVQISYGDNNQIINNVINQSNSAGHNAIYLFSTADNTLIESNNMTTNVTIVDEDAHAVLFISGSSFTNVSNNQMNNSNQVGFYVTGTTEAHYDHNFSNNHHDGLPAKYFGPNDVSTNFSDTTVNALWVAKDNFIVNNINITNSKGVILAYANNVVINETSAVSSLANIEGLYLIHSEDNLIYHSNFSTSASSTSAVNFYSGSNSNRNSFYNCIFSTTSTSAHGIQINDENSDNNLVDNSIIETTGGAAHGIYITSGDNNNITNSNITCTGSGSHATYLEGTANSNLIENSQITALIGTAAYIYGSSASNNILKNNYFHSNRSSVPAVQISYGDGNQIINNVINQSNSAGHNAIYLFSTADNTLIESNNLSNVITTLDLDGHSVLRIDSSVNANITNNYFENPYQTKIYINSNSYGIDVSHNIINTTHSGMDSIYVASGATTQVNNFTNNTIIGPRINLDGMQTNWWNNTFLAEDGSTSIMYSSLQIDGNSSFQLDDANLLVVNNISAVNSSHTALNDSFNVSANVSFYNINCSAFAIYHNTDFISNHSILIGGTAVATQTNINGNCTGNVCTGISCTDHIITMTVPSWSSFAVNESISSNTAPTVSSVNITSSDSLNRTNGTLTGTHSFSDEDDDPETDNETQWYNNSNWINNLDNFTSIDSANTTKGDNWTFSVRAYDNINWSEWVNSSIFTIENTIPFFEQSLTSQSANSGIEFTYDINCSDIDDDTVTYYDNTSFFDIDPSTGVITDTPDQSEAGTHNINITCGDSTINVSQTFAYTINDATVPTFSDAVNISAAFQRYQNFTANITINNTALDYYIFSTNASGTWDNVTRDISGAQYNASEDANISLAQSEQICWYYWTNDSSNNNATSTTYCFNVINTAPTFNQSLTSQSANSGIEFTYDINCSDIDDDTVTYYDNTSFFDIDPSTGVITDTPDQSEAGTHNINITCGDSTINVSQTFAYTINDATVPTFSDAVNISAAFQRYQNFTANITINNTALDYYIFSTNASGTWDNVTRDISGAQYNASEDANISLAQSEQICWYYWTNDSSNNNATSTTYCFNVINTAPTPSSVNITSNDGQNRTNGTLTTFYTYSDIDSDSETNNKTQWYNDSNWISSLDNLTSINSANTTKGESWLFSIQVYDGTDWSEWVNSSILNITNTAPIFDETLTNQSINENTEFSYQINCSDIDEDTLTYYDNTSLFNINSSNGLISDTPNNLEIGSHNINITCSDSTSNVSQTFIYTVNEVITATPILPSGGGGGRDIKECNNNLDCPDGEYCLDYKCVEYQCIQKSDCSYNEYCVDYRCVKLFDLKILQFDSPVEPGEFLDFTYLMKLMADYSGDVNLDFWLENNEKEKVTSRSEVIFINAFEEKIEKSQLFLPSNLVLGQYTLWTKLNFEDYEITSHATVEINSKVPLTLNLAPLELPKIIPRIPWSYSAVLSVNKDSLIPVVMKRNITQKGKLIWLEDSETVINRSIIITDDIPGLKTGEYLLEWSVSTGETITHSKKMFRVGEPTLNKWWRVSLLLLLGLIGAGLTLLYWRKKRKKKGPEKKAKELKDFITASIKHGISKEEIGKMLINQGWPKNIIEDYLKETKEKTTSYP